ncbi:MAG: hypothetical protein K0S55_399, partial [Clostridia bacterium]|nr:hypothetical protein [Clostridia bacterium]
VLKTDAETILKAAAEMGLKTPKQNFYYLTRGYITIIRNNWHLLPYDQLMKLWDIDEERLAYILKEDDFLDIKLGRSKPFCLPVIFKPLTPEEKNKTEKIKKWTEMYFNTDNIDYDISEDFDFLHKFKKPFKIYKKISTENVFINQNWSFKDDTGSKMVLNFIDNFKKTVKERWNFALNGNLYFITLEITPDKSKKSESHIVDIKRNGITIKAVDENGILRGLQFLLMLSEGKELFCMNEGYIARDTRFDTRIIYSYCALYGDAFSGGGEDSYPDELLEEYARIGINGIWLQAVLYRMAPFKWEPNLSEGYENRLVGLKLLTERAALYGIKVFLYINEPRSMPVKFFDKYPELKGQQIGDNATMCTSVQEVKDYIKESIKLICQKAPEIGGFITITSSENLTSCISHKLNTDCPHCKQRNAWEIIAEVNSLVAEGAWAVNTDIKVLAWTWAWHNEEFLMNAISSLPKGVRVMCVSEEGVPANIGGVDTQVLDYSIGLVGPGNRSLKAWKKAEECGLEKMAKVQFNNTWECSTVPYIPTLKLVEQHMRGLVEAKVDGIMLGWTLGGYPSLTLELMAQYYWTGNEDYDRLENLCGKSNIGIVKSASDIFSKAFQEFPFHIGTLYTAPQNMGAANPLFTVPTGRGATMTCYPYDDINAWRSVFPVDVFENQLKLLSEKWEIGIELLKNLSDEAASSNPVIKDFIEVATAVYCIFKSTYSQTQFVILRDKEKRTGNFAEDILQNKESTKMQCILKDEIDSAVTLYHTICKNSAIGYEAANHYFYNRYNLMEKVLCCMDILDSLNCNI